MWRRPSANVWLDSLHSDGRLVRPRLTRAQALYEQAYQQALYEPASKPQQKTQRWEDSTDAHEKPMAWQRLKDGKRRDYYFNTITKKSQWAMPETLLKQHEENENEWEEDDNPNTAAV
eukprot:COSAG05_NODE_1789_length_4083_cov_4.713353_4_plen_118_part_00